MLSRYVTDTQNLLNDNQGQFFTIPTLTNYVNRSRRRIAAASNCLRLMPKGTRTHPGQEIYPFSDWTALVQDEMPGVESILFVRSLAIAIGKGGWKPTWKQLGFTDFQARMRVFNGTWIGSINEPGWYAQLGSGALGKLYLAPIPSTEMPMDIDATCIPLPLLTDNDPEPIPYPWSDAVCYWAAVLALLQQQRPQDAQAMAQLFNAELPQCAAVVCPMMIVNPYGPALRSA